MKNNSNRKLMNKIEDFLTQQNPPMNDLLYALIQLDLGLYEPMVNEVGKELYCSTDGISRDDARVFFNTPFKNEFVTAFNKKYKNRLKWQTEQKEWDREAYERFCKKYGVKP